MGWTADELRRRCAESGSVLPPLAEAAAGTGGAAVYACTMGGAEGFQAWYGLRELHRESGWWPFLVGDRTPAAAAAGPQLLERGRQLDGARLLATRILAAASGRPAATGLADAFTQVVNDLAAGLAGTVDLDAVGSLYPASLHREQVTLCVIQARHGYEVPALLAWPGAWAGGAEHYAILRYLHEHYGADLLTLEPFRMDLLVTNRPRTAVGAAQAALELHAYCPDILSRGAGSLLGLVETQVRNSTWSLWWLAAAS